MLRIYTAIFMDNRQPRKLTIIIHLVISLIYCANCKAQNDLGTWINAGVYIPWNVKWKTMAYLEYRSKNHNKSTDLYSLGFVTHYKWSDYLKIGGSYDFFSTHQSKDTYECEHRLIAEAVAQYVMGKWGLSWRPRAFFLTTDFEKYTWYARNRLKLDYRFRPSLNPYLSYEPHHYMRHFEYYRTRWMIGVDYTKEHHLIGLYYMLETKKGTNDIKNIIGIDYFYHF